MLKENNIIKILRLHKIKYILHVLFFSIYPVLNLLLYNIIELNPKEISFIFLVFPCISFIFMAILFLITRNFLKSALLTSLSAIYFYNTNIFYAAIYDSYRVKLNIFLFFSGIIFICIIFCLNKISNISLKKINIIFNTVSFALIFSCFIGFSPNIYKNYISNNSNVYKEKSYTVADKKSFNKPNIYYLVFDYYSNHIPLKKYFNYDNSNFLKKLRELGFFVAEKSTANYPVTIFSMTSTLNMDYLNFEKDRTGFHDASIYLKKLRAHSRVINELKSQGYKFFFHYPVPRSSLADMQNLSDFPLFYEEKALIFSFTLFKNSFLGLFESIVNFTSDKWIYKSLEKRLKNSFDFLSESPKLLDEPVFIYAHIYAPHPPYLLDKNGLPLKPEKITDKKILKIREFYGSDLNLPTGSLKATETTKAMLEHYTEYISYLNKKIIETVEQIIKQSKHPPIIIIQSDHGSLGLNKVIAQNIILENIKKGKKVKNLCSELKSRYINNYPAIQTNFGILNAYYLPGINQEKVLYNSITPVNSFRILLRDYFGYKMDLLEDKNYSVFCNCPFEKSQNLTDKVKHVFAE